MLPLECGRVRVLRKTGQTLPSDGQRAAAARFRPLRLGLQRGPARLHRGDDAADRRHRRVRGAAVRDAGRDRRLAGTGAAWPPVGTARQHAGAAGGRAGGQHAAGGGAVDVQASGAVRQLPDAPALELPPAAAAAEHELLPGRVRRAHRHQADADRAGGARCVDDPGRHPRLRADLLRHHGGGGRRLRPLAAAALPGVGVAVPGGAALLRAAPGAHRQGAGRRTLADDRAHHRRLHQHRHRQAVLARRARGRLRALGDAGVPAAPCTPRCAWSAASRSSTTCSASR